MSFKSTYEFGIHIDSFRNIDLFQQGLYFLQFYIYTQKDKKVQYAQPYYMIQGVKKEKVEEQKEPQKQGIRGFDRQSWAPPQILDESFAFQTQTFLIRFCQEEVEINDICFFKIDIDAFPTYDTQPFYMKCELMCADLNSIGQAQSDEVLEKIIFSTQYIFFYLKKESKDSIYKCTSVYKAKINNAANGIHEYIPVMFDENHFCLANTTFHSLLLDFKFRLNDFQISLVDNFSSKSSMSSAYSKENMKSAPILLQPKTFTEFLNKATNRFQKEDVEKFYSYYILGLREGFASFLQFIQEIQGRFLTSKIKGTNSSLNSELPLIPEPAFMTEGQNVMMEKEKSKMIPLGEYNHHNFQKKQISCITDVFQVSNFKEQQKIANSMMSDINATAGILFQLWNRNIELIKLFSTNIISFLKEEYQSKVKERYGESIFRNKIITSDFTRPDEPQPGKSHEEIANQMRKKSYYLHIDPMNIEDIQLFPKADLHPIVFEEVYLKDEQFQQEKNRQRQYKGVHLFVLCHGFQGNSFDMRLLKNNLSIMYPQSLFICSKINEDATDGDIKEMGKNLSIQVKGYISQWCPGNALGRISFIGHSLGGLIIRASLPYLSDLSEQMYTYMSLGSPHLGVMYNSSQLVNAGLWVINQFRKSQCLTQMSMNDVPQFEDTCLYQLSKATGLCWFENIVLVSSYQDQYSPFESSRMQKCVDVNMDQTSKQRYNTMVDNIIGEMKTSKVYRIDVNFKIDEKTIDNMIGRKAHILFLESDPLAQMFINCFDHLFK